MGKQMVMYVLGLAILMGMALLNMHQTGISMDDLYWARYGKSMTHAIAKSGANIATSLCLADYSYDDNLLDRPFAGGSYSVYITKAGDSTMIRSIGRYNIRYYDYASGTQRTAAYDTIDVKLRRIYFSEYGYFTDDENFNYLDPTSNTVPPPGTPTRVYKVTGDSLFGPVHTNGTWNFIGSPYFGGKVTGGIPPHIGGSSTPIFNGGSEWGVDVERPDAKLDDIEAAATSGGKYWTSANTGGKDVGLTFAGSGSVRVKIPWNTGASKDTTYASVNALSSNGVIGVEGIDVRVSGTYKGAATVLARTGSASLKGNIWIQGDLVAGDNPLTNPSSQDIMGLVAERMNYVTTTGISRNASSNTNIQAAIYSQNGIFAVENYDDVPISGRLNLTGSIVGKAAMVIGTVLGNGTQKSGMIRSLRYDTRFLSKSPPKFPSADKDRIVSWWER